MNHKQPLLILEDDSTQQAVMARMLADSPYSITLVDSAEAALAAFEQIQHPVALLDIHLPNGGSGIDVLRQLLEKPRPPIAIMLTGDSGIQQILTAMRAGAYDYVVKPVTASELNETVVKAMRQSHTLALARSADVERRRQLEAQLATKRLAERLQRKQDDKFSAALFGNIYTSFAQGKGVGVMSSLISLLPGSTLLPDGKSFQIDKDIVEMLLDNQVAVSQMIQMFSELQLLVTQDMVLHDMTLGELHGIMRDLIFEMQEQAAYRQHTLILSELPPMHSGVQLKINWEFFRKALRELLLNAMKFSPSGTQILVLVEYLFTHASITVLNTPEHNASTGALGIPEEFRRVIFDPFFRLAKTVNEQYNTLEYGLGLTFVEKVMRMHKGNVRNTEITDYFQSSATGDRLVAFEIELPT